MVNTNMRSLRFSGESYTLYKRRSEKGLVDRLRKEQRGRSLFFYHEGSIYRLPWQKDEGPQKGERKESLSIGAYPRIDAGLWHRVLFAWIQARGSNLLTHDPIWVQGKEVDELEGAIPQISLYKSFALASHLFEKNGQYNHVLSGVLRPLLHSPWTCAKWRDAGVDLQGIEIFRHKGEVWDYPANKSSQRRLGRVEKVLGNRLILSPSRGQASADAHEVYPLMNYWQARKLMRQTTSNSDVAEWKEGILKENLADFNNPELQRQEMEKLFDGLQDKEISNGLDFSFRVEGRQDWELTPLSSPHFLFSRVSHPQKSRLLGLKTLKPIKKPDNRCPSIYILRREGSDEYREKFVQSFKYGEDRRSGNTEPFLGGFSEMFGLDDLRLSHSKPLPDRWEAYETEIQERLDKTDLFIIEAPDDKKDDTIYLNVKRYLLSRQKPVQVIRTSSLQLQGTLYSDMLKNVALSCFVKLGGVPWRLQVADDRQQQLIVGVGKRYPGGQQASQAVMGITSVFTGSGEFMLNYQSKPVVQRDFATVLLELLEKSLIDAKKANNWLQDSEVRVIFHLSDHLRKDTQDKIEEGLKQTAQTLKLKFIYLRIGRRHNLRIWDTGQVLPPGSGYALQLDHNRALLELGNKQTTAFGGKLQPILIHRSGNSEGGDLMDLVTQVYHFTQISARSFEARTRPVTLEYSREMALLAGRLEARFDSETVKTIIHTNQNRIWFL